MLYCTESEGPFDSDDIDVVFIFTLPLSVGRNNWKFCIKETVNNSIVQHAGIQSFQMFQNRLANLRVIHQRPDVGVVKLNWPHTYLRDFLVIHAA